MYSQVDPLRNTKEIVSTEEKGLFSSKKMIVSPLLEPQVKTSPFCAAATVWCLAAAIVLTRRAPKPDITCLGVITAAWPLEKEITLNFQFQKCSTETQAIKSTIHSICFMSQQVKEFKTKLVTTVEDSSQKWKQAFTHWYGKKKKKKNLHPINWTSKTDRYARERKRRREEKSTKRKRASKL